MEGPGIVGRSEGNDTLERGNLWEGGGAVKVFVYTGKLRERSGF